jgi:hypothetical protein
MRKQVNFRRRSPSEVFKHHGSAGERRDLEAYVSDFSPRIILITPDRVYLGRTGLREWVLSFWDKLQDGKFRVLTETRTENVIFVRSTTVPPNSIASSMGLRLLSSGAVISVY